MPGSLIQRYTYGNFADYPALPLETDFYGLSTRHRELIQLTRAQIAVQQHTAAAIIQSSVECADVIRRELMEQTEQLQRTIRAGTDEVVSAIGQLADQVVAELGEIRWELIQLKAISAQVLEVLKRPRSTEAGELLQQGVRNLINDKLEQAEERFLLALKLDNTDYQVLMNLSAVALRKGNVEQAITYLTDALTLPPALDARSKADALWSLARIRYALEDYGAASEVAQHSLSLLSEPRRVLQRGAYCILAGQLQQGLALIEGAIQSEPGMFAVAVSTPDLAAHRQAVLALLERLARERLGELHRGLDAVVSDLPPAAPDHLTAFLDAHKKLAQLVQASSYSECCRLLIKLGALGEARQRLTSIQSVAKELAQAEEGAKEAAEDLEAAQLRRQKIAQISKTPGWLSAGGGCVTYILISSVLLPAFSGEGKLGALWVAFFAGIAVAVIAYRILVREAQSRERAFLSAQGKYEATRLRAAEAGRKLANAEEAFRQSLARAR